MKKMLVGLSLIVSGCAQSCVPITLNQMREEFQYAAGTAPETADDYLKRGVYLIKKRGCRFALPDLKKAEELVIEKAEGLNEPNPEYGFLLARINFRKAQCYEYLAWNALSYDIIGDSISRRRQEFSDYCQKAQESLHLIPEEYLTPEVMGLHQEMDEWCPYKGDNSF